jgi:hypothetical protein
MNRANYTGALRPEQQFPLSTQGLDFIQQQIMLVSEFAKSAGGNYILSGAVTTGNAVSDGVLVLNGEIIRFVGGAKQSTIRIVEVADSVTANGLNYENAYVRRWAEFGSNVGGVDTFNWADIKPSFMANLDHSTGWKTPIYVPAGDKGNSNVQYRLNFIGQLVVSGSVVVKNSDYNNLGIRMSIPSNYRKTSYIITGENRIAIIYGNRDENEVNITFIGAGTHDIEHIIEL